MEILGYLVTAVLAYLLGSIPTGYLFARAHGIDIRTVGSGNIGATNAFRVLGKKIGVTVLLLDALKGYLACRFLQVGQGAPDDYHAMTAGFSAILGHNYTCWLKFKGGKGIATSAGVLLYLVPVGLGIAFAVWAVVFATSRYVSLASLAAAFCLPFGVWLSGASSRLVGLTAILGALAIFKHKANIKRLLNGTENRIGGKKPSVPAPPKT